ncbi:MAG TPA: matrixin family metalloprotease, partial [Terriglobales bacterium]|nr:matrixin family metalloprotease [Terriglobales bacterium]
VNTSISAGAKNSEGGVMITPSSNPLSALTAAEGAWEGVTAAAIRFLPLVTTTLENNLGDGKSTMTMADTPENRSVVGDYLAITLYQYDANGAISDSDIIFNPRIVDGNGKQIPFSTDDEPNTYDLRSVATHELGHALGADHSAVLGATMNFATSPISDFAGVADATVQSTISSDDVAFARRVYPASASLVNIGAIRGTVSLSNGYPILGGSVVAVDPATGVIVQGMTSLVDGTYTISPVPIGNYLIYVQPLNGPVGPSDLGINASLVTSTFRTTFAGGNASPWSTPVQRGLTSIANIAVDSNPARLRISYVGVGSAGGADWSYAGVKTVKAGGYIDVLVWGPNLSTTVTEDQLRILGPGVKIVPGTLTSQKSAVVDGMVPIRFTVEVAPTASRNLISIGIVNGTDAAIRSGGLVVVPNQITRQRPVTILTSPRASASQSR